MTGNERIKVDTDKMRAVVRILENQMSIIRNCYDAMNRDALSLRGVNWDGMSADVYYESMRELCSQQSTSGKISAGHIVDILREYINDLNFTANEFDRTEGRVIGRVEALPSAVFDI